MPTRRPNLSRTKARTAGSTVTTCRGVKPRETRRRNVVWSGGSSITIGGLSAMPSFASSPYSTESPSALLNVVASVAAAITSA